MPAKFIDPLGAEHQWYEELGAMGMTYDDVLLVGQPNSEVDSRSQVDTSVQFGPYRLKSPITAAPMDTVVGERMARVLAEFGGIAFIPRGPIEQVEDLCRRLTTDNIPAVYSVGNGNSTRDAEILKKAGAEMLLLDVANGGMKNVLRICAEIKEKTGLVIVAGNIATYDQAKVYRDASGIDIARVGIGGGGMCTTRLVAGTGVPQLAAVLDTCSIENGLPVIADAGIRQPGDVAKAMAAGARVVMIGSWFGGTDEAPGEVNYATPVHEFAAHISDKVAGFGVKVPKWIEEKINRDRYKIVRGQASYAYMQDNGVGKSRYRAPEGAVAKVKYRGALTPILDEIEAGLRSAMSYAGAWTIPEFQQKARFVRVSPATAHENGPHGGIRIG